MLFNGLVSSPAASGGSVFHTCPHGFCNGERCVCAGVCGALQRDRVVSHGCHELGKPTHSSPTPSTYHPSQVPGIARSRVTRCTGLARSSVPDKSLAPDRPSPAQPGESLAVEAPTSTTVERGSNGVSATPGAGKHEVPGNVPHVGCNSLRGRRKNTAYHRLELSFE